jgi:hypothetical protein
MQFELLEELPDEKKPKVAKKEETDEATEEIGQAVVVSTSKPEWLANAIRNARAGRTIEPTSPPPAKEIEAVKPGEPEKHTEPMKVSRDINVIEIGEPIPPQAREGIMRLVEPESKVRPITLEKPPPQVTDEIPAIPRRPQSVLAPGEETEQNRPARRGSKERPAESKRSKREAKPTELDKRKKSVRKSRDEELRRGEQPEATGKKVKEQKAKKEKAKKEKAPEKVTGFRKVLDVVHIVLAVVCFVGGTALAIYILQGNLIQGNQIQGNQIQGGEIEDNNQQELITHGELNFYLPENWYLLSNDDDTVIRIRGGQGEIIGAMLIRTHIGDTESSLEENFEHFSETLHTGVNDFQMNEEQFGNIPVRRYSYISYSGETEAIFNSFIVPSGTNMKYVQLRKPVNSFNQELIAQFDDIAMNLDYLPSEFTSENN